MKFLRIDLLTLLISLFILGSCKNPDNIGLDPDKALQANLIDTSTIVALTQPDDSVLTSGSAVTKLPLSYFKDPIFGTTEANIAASISLPGNVAYTIPTGTITIDSAILVLKYADGFYGDSINTSYTVNVYQLNAPLDASKGYYTSYYNNNSKNPNLLNTPAPAPLGTFAFHASPHTSRKIMQIVKGAKDTLATLVPHIRVTLPPAFINTNLFNATTGQLGTNSIFQNSIKGLYITLDQVKTTGTGGNIFIDMQSYASTIDVYYRTVNAGVIDTSVISLPVGSLHAGQIKHTYSTEVQDHINQKLSDKIYLQGLSGLRAKISFPYLKKLLPKTTDSDVIVNRAELVVTPVAGTTIPDYLKPTPRLSMYRYDQANQRTYIPDAYSADPHFLYGAFGGFYDTYHKSYHYIITGYVENLMRGTTIDYGTYIAPTDTTSTIDVFNRADVAARTVVGGNKTSPYRMKLNIIYNKVAK